MEEKVEFKMEGPILETEMPLHIMLTGLTEMQTILDKSFLVLSGRSRVTSTDRERYKINISNIKHGSFDADLVIQVLVGIQPLLPFMTTVDSKSIWEHTKLSFDLLKTLFTITQRGDTPNIENSGNGSIIIHNGDVHNTYNAPVIQIAESSLQPYQNLTKLFEKGVNKITCSEERSSVCAIKLVSDDVNLFRLPSKVLPDVSEIDCEIFDFDKYHNRGKLSVAPEQEISEGEYSFSVIGDQDVKLYIQSMLKRKVTVKCHIEESVNPFNKSNVTKLQIIELVA